MATKWYKIIMLIIVEGGVNNLVGVNNQIIIVSAVSVEVNKIKWHVLLCEYAFIIGCYLIV